MEEDEFDGWTSLVQKVQVELKELIGVRSPKTVIFYVTESLPLAKRFWTGAGWDTGLAAPITLSSDLSWIKVKLTTGTEGAALGGAASSTHSVFSSGVRRATSSLKRLSSVKNMHQTLDLQEEGAINLPFSPKMGLMCQVKHIAVLQKDFSFAHAEILDTDYFLGMTPSQSSESSSMYESERSSEEDYPSTGASPLRHSEKRTISGYFESSYNSSTSLLRKRKSSVPMQMDPVSQTGYAASEFVPGFSSAYSSALPIPSVSTPRGHKVYSSSSEGESEDDEERSLIDEFYRRMKYLQRGGEDFAGLIKVHSLIQEFVYAASSLARVIVDEAKLPSSKMTIRPLVAGGTLGGRKYLCRQIRFKFASDDDHLFDNEGEFYAAKIAGHELSGMMAAQGVGVRGLRFPLMAIIDYNGYRVIAMTELPIDGTSLCWGSDTGGKTVFRDEPEAPMDELTEKLNLAEHWAGLSMESAARLATPVDVEVHKWKDTYYMLDFSRMMPPNVAWGRTLQMTPNAHLYQLFRPEFVAQYLKPLSSDGFSQFQADHKEAERLNGDLLQARKYLIGVVIPEGAADMERIWVALGQRIDRFNLTEWVHRYGINMRLLGELLSHTRSASLKQVMQLEMVLRALKHRSRLALREASSSNRTEVLITLLNKAFGAESSDVFLREVQGDAMLYFRAQFTYWTRADFESITFMESTGKIDALHLLLRNFSEKLGIKLPTQVELSLPFPFSLTANICTEPVVKTSTLISVLAAKATLIESESAHVARQQKFLLQEVLKLLRPALAMRPHDSELLATYGIAYLSLCTLIKDRTELLNHTIIAREYLYRAVQINGKNSQLQAYYASVLYELELVDDAQEHFVRALQLDRNNIIALESYADFLNATGLTGDAQDFLDRAKKVKGDKKRLESRKDEKRGQGEESLITQ